MILAFDHIWTWVWPPRWPWPMGSLVPHVIKLVTCQTTSVPLLNRRGVESYSLTSKSDFLPPLFNTANQLSGREVKKSLYPYFTMLIIITIIINILVPHIIKSIVLLFTC